MRLAARSLGVYAAITPQASPGLAVGEIAASLGTSFMLGEAVLLAYSPNLRGKPRLELARTWNRSPMPLAPSGCGGTNMKNRVTKGLLASALALSLALVACGTDNPDDGTSTTAPAGTETTTTLAGTTTTVAP